MKNSTKNSFVILIFLFLMVTSVYAHEPSEMDVSYSAISGKLNITVHHKVNSISVHYINKIEISLNRQGIELEDRMIISQEFFSQPIRNEQRAAYIVNDLNPGDKLRIIAYCNLFGTIEKTLTISDKNWQENTEP